MKKIAFILSLLAALWGFSALAEPEIHVSGEYYYTLLEDGTAQIVSYAGDAATLTLPAALEGHAVAAVGTLAFEYCTSLQEVVIPEGVTAIGENAFFGCDALMHVTLPLSLTALADNPFAYCGQLLTIDVPAEHPTLAVIDEALYDAHRLVCWPMGLMTARCEIPDGTQSIGEHAFFSCDSLQEVLIPASVSEIAAEAFLDCSPTLTLLVSAGSCAEQYAREHAIAFTRTDAAVFDLPDALTILGAEAFAGCRLATDVILPFGLTSIGENAFSDCSPALRLTVIRDSFAEYYALENGLDFTNTTISN